MSIVNNNYREHCAQTFLAHGVIISSICTAKAAMAKTAIRTGCLGLAALAASSASVSAVQSCFNPETVDVNSFFTNFSKPFKEGADISHKLIISRIEPSNYEEKIERMRTTIHDFLINFNDN